VKHILRTKPGGWAALSGVMVLSSVLILVALVAAGCGAGGSSGTAPDFQVTTFAGDEVSLSQYQGKPLVLAFMASW
jgi:hypothetical protein